ncbi:GntR family transcriptional regulator [Macromonas nakdongensis]|uniref:GntR family transcriptional regulator n=1 Tax=Macromonas nakdongensis TaxID=1843082 RepID=UPI000C3493E0|nr:GntR family transcriptional regulator [Macromonas nakdongensis]
MDRSRRHPQPRLHRVEATPGASHSPLTMLVVEKMRARILDGSLSPGQRLVEGRMSAEFDVSRIPVREALRQLAAEGLVTIEPRRGASVSCFSTEQVRDLVEVRANLEALNAKLAARRTDPDTRAQLRALLEQGNRLAELQNLEALAEFNHQFHDVVGRAAGNSVLQEVMRSLRDRTLLLFTPYNRSRCLQNWEDHAAILRAVLNNDAELASVLALGHVYNAAEMEP